VTTEIFKQLETYGPSAAVVSVVWMFLRFLSTCTTSLISALSAHHALLLEVRDLLNALNRKGT
jgi:hypothetical protein